LLRREPRQCAAVLRQNIRRDLAVSLPAKRECSGNLMPSQLDRRNDARLLTPLLVMALVIAAGVLFYALTGHALAAA
jgi:type VI protein secretion system component VasF